jgi:tRNA threonylcarbamoyladenosine biosynthesis protein TsaB
MAAESPSLALVMTVLAIDTSTNRGSVVVLVTGELQLEEQFNAERSHSTTLFAALERAREIVPSFDRMAIGLGPGSYAGVRIAVAAAMGMQMVGSGELVGIPSVAALDTGTADYVVIGDARRSTFYWTHVRDGICCEGPLLLDETALRERLTVTHLPVFATESVPGFEQAALALPTASILARLATIDRGIVMRGDLEPIYLREPHITQPKPR